MRPVPFTQGRALHTAVLCGAARAEGVLMKWTVSLPRKVAEDDKVSVEVEADSIEEAIEAAWYQMDNSTHVPVGQVFNVHCRVEVAPYKSLPLRSV